MSARTHTPVSRATLVYPVGQTTGHQLTVLDFLREVYLPSRIELSENYASLLESVVRKFSAFLGRPAELQDLNDTTVCNYLCEHRRQWSAVSTNDHRRMLLTLWRSAWDRELTTIAPRPTRIRKLPEETDPPEAWTEQQVAALMESASGQHGTVSGILACDWWASLLLTVYWTSCRIGALLATPVASYDGSGLLVRKQKNHRPQWYPLPGGCCQAIERTQPGGRILLWPWPWHRNRLYIEMRRIIGEAGIPCASRGMALFHRLRRTTLSLCAAVDPAVAQRAAGHADYSTTVKHYIDPRVARGRSPADIIFDPLPQRPRLRIVS